MKLDALVTAGGRGTRIKELGIEKPMVPLLGKHMIDYVLDALRSAETVGDIYVSVSRNTPLTKNHLSNTDVTVIETSGEEYCADLNSSMKEMKTKEVFICPSDMPLITPSAIDSVVRGYYTSGVHSYSAAVPCSVLSAMGIECTYSMPVNGTESVFCGVSVLDRLDMLTGEPLTEGFMVTDRTDLILNVNSRNELKIAEKLLLSPGY